MTGNGPLFASAQSALEWGMQQTGTELSGLPRFPVEFIDIPAIHSDTEMGPNMTTDDFQQKRSHNHRRNLFMPVSIRPIWASGGR